MAKMSKANAAEAAMATRGEAPRVMFNRHRGNDSPQHGREGNLGGVTNGPDYMPSDIASESRPVNC